MTLGTVTSAMAALGSVLLVARALAALRALPDVWGLGADPVRRGNECRAILTSLFAALALPGLLWLALNRFSNAGLMELF
jgi:hypothetical protein